MLLQRKITQKLYLVLHWHSCAWKLSSHRDGCSICLAQFGVFLFYQVHSAQNEGSNTKRHKKRTFWKMNFFFTSSKCLQQSELWAIHPHCRCQRAWGKVECFCSVSWNTGRQHGNVVDLLLGTRSLVVDVLVRVEEGVLPLCRHRLHNKIQKKLEHLHPRNLTNRHEFH